MEQTQLQNKNLFTALSKAQSEIEAATKTQKNEAFKKDGKASKYADISDVLDAIREPAGKNGLSVFFNYKSTVDAANPRAWIQYIISHSSGEQFISEWTLMYLRDHTMHGFGSGNTYYRRQLLKGIYQIPEEDDDGNAQSGVNTPPPNKTIFPQNNPQQYRKDVDKFKAASDLNKNLASQPPKLPDSKIDPDLDAYLNMPGPEEIPLHTKLQDLYDLVEENAVPHETVKGYIKQITGSVKSSAALTEFEIDVLLTKIKTNLKSP